MPTPRRYSADEVREILRRAAERSTGDGLAHDELVSVAGEVGLDAEAVEQAAREVSEQRGLNELRARMKSARRAGLFWHAVSYLLVNAGLAALCLALGGGLLFVVPLVLWGIGLGFHAVAALRGPSDEAVREEFAEQQKLDEREKKAQARRDAKAEKKARAEAEREAEQEAERARRDDEARRDESHEALREAGRAFGAAVEKGAVMALRAAAERIDEAARDADTPGSESDFARYLREKKNPGGAAKERPAQPARTGVRVSLDGAEPPTTEREGDEATMARERPRSTSRGAR